MTKHLRITLMIVAVMLFMSAYLVDITSLGRHWDLVWEFDLKRMLLTLFIIVVTGLFLGLLFFRKKLYIQRLSLTVPIGVILFSLLILGNMLIFEYGLFDNYNYFTAKRDIKNGKIQLLTDGNIIEPVPEDELKVEDSFRKVFGYTVINIGIWSPGVDKYNNTMEAYLEERHGKGWNDLLTKKIDSVRKARH